MTLENYASVWRIQVHSELIVFGYETKYSMGGNYLVFRIFLKQYWKDTKK